MSRTVEKVVEITYRECFQKFLSRNEPFILSGTADHGTKSWRSREAWVKDGRINFTSLVDLFGNTIVPVADCKHEKFSAHPKVNMKMVNFITYWKDLILKDYPPDSEIFYLKDWHFNKAFPEYKAYKTPIYFSSDWLNEFWDTRDDNDDYRFVYMGPKGSWTPFHADVFRSFSWSANVCGKKKWILFPPGEEKCLTNKYGHLAFDVTSSELKDENLYPNYRDLQHCYEVVQEEGEIIFVPSGWHHQVHNLEDTISINHNWINGCNVGTSWEYIKASLRDVQREILDCRDMEGWDNQCQIILKASSGIDFHDFFAFMELIAENRIKRLKEIFPGVENGQNSWIQTGISVKSNRNSESANSSTINPESEVFMVKQSNLKDGSTASLLEKECNILDTKNCEKSDIGMCFPSVIHSDHEILGSLNKNLAEMKTSDSDSNSVSRECSDSSNTDKYHVTRECSDSSNTVDKYHVSTECSDSSNKADTRECLNSSNMVDKYSVPELHEQKYLPECLKRQLVDIGNILNGLPLPNDFNPEHPIHLIFDLKVVKNILNDMMQTFKEVELGQELLSTVSNLILKIDHHTEKHILSWQVAL